VFFTRTSSCLFVCLLVQNPKILTLPPTLEILLGQGQLKKFCRDNPHLGTVSFFCFFFFEAATQLARRVQPNSTQVACSNKVGRSRLAQRHSRNGPRTYEYSFDVYIHIFFFCEVHIRIRRHTNNRGREQNTNEQ